MIFGKVVDRRARSLPSYIYKEPTEKENKIVEVVDNILKKIIISYQTYNDDRYNPPKMPKQST